MKGEVERPGVYEFDQGYRVDDAIRMAGGVSETGNEAYVNFAQVLTDEMVIYVLMRMRKKDH
ncbi:hypothetical protein JCM19037_2532 [Geomicrobium sp. JCM 19037]|uniref:SLBB domain-containing protein n=1 Tax=Geomicrobium sp. JCM 19037 TaxID=1460634 RepID=UPI00045F4894|nr:SLBB domain-containing protein [Geomicrobium sp. JCM 19037]GAK04150.1 hypothetical protein JCM19037_2532 [Geomicrobium sp. JCM 19037]